LTTGNILLYTRGRAQREKLPRATIKGDSGCTKGLGGGKGAEVDPQSPAGVINKVPTVKELIEGIIGEAEAIRRRWSLGSEGSLFLGCNSLTSGEKGE